MNYNNQIVIVVMLKIWTLEYDGKIMKRQLYVYKTCVIIEINNDISVIVC